MALSWNEIKDRALQFSVEWEGESHERAEKDSFWNDFFNVFGINRRRVATFEHAVKKLDNRQGFIDLFWSGNLLVEHKSLGKDLEAAFEQATDYFAGLKDFELPKYILVSDFAKFRLYDLDSGDVHQFPINELHKKVELFGFIAGYQKRKFEEEDPVNLHAAELMGQLHDQLKEIGYTGHSLEQYLVRLLFCMFADDTGIFEKDTFKEYVEVKTNVDGSDLGALLAQFFQVLNTPRESRLKSLDEHLMKFPYINGKLFEEALPIAAFNSSLRHILLDCCSLDWGQISPAIFGSMFQSVMNPAERRNLGAHYTSEKNILKLIRPLFLDELWATFHKVKDNKKKLLDFHDSLAELKFLDPACGCGNFLVVTYRELRILELAVIKTRLFKFQRIREEVANEARMDISALVKVNVDQFFGIEHDEFPVRIAEVAMWLMDHQMNLQISQVFGTYFARLPLQKSATIVHGNALRTNWEEVIPPNELNYIMGNPPFVGSKLLNEHQREEMANLFSEVRNGKILDYVAAWYLLASRFIQSTNIRCGFVSTNSITQGEQVGVLWRELSEHLSIKIHFAHTTFRWSNEAKGRAAVYVVIIGFANFDTTKKSLFIYSNINGDPVEVNCRNINPYLVDSNDLFIERRSRPMCDVPRMAFGNMPLDGGNLLIDDSELDAFLEKEPLAKQYVLPLISAREFLNNKRRWCLWLLEISPSELRAMPEIMKRVEAVKEFRLRSRAPSTQQHAATPTLFRDRNRPKTSIVIPRVSSENRKYIPMGFFGYESIISDTCMSIPNGSIFNFGVLMSEMHMAWVKYTCGRLKGDFRYSKDIVYNNFPWPLDPSEKNINQVEVKAQQILDVRAQYPDSSLADLYDPLSMPPPLAKAHKELDKAVDHCYRPQPFTNEMARIEYLFGLYEGYTKKENE